jgi:2-polyprenyl-3-methyl-5-hydroxy-6-metoxy-1,4-benzoquinol methylase
MARVQEPAATYKQPVIEGDLRLNECALNQVFLDKYGPITTAGPNVRRWHRLGYFTPDEYYESLVAKIVDHETSWLDVGCGRSVFPNNAALARKLAMRCRLLVGIDPDASIHSNTIVHRKVQTTIEEFEPGEPFDLVTLRMVAEHIPRPELLLDALVRLTHAKSIVVLITPNRFSPLSLAATLVPHRWHHALKKVAWQTRREDTFPVAYRLNSRKQLRRWFQAAGFKEVLYRNPADCSATWRFPRLHCLELALWKCFSRLGLIYPENCILAAFERQ